MVPVADVHFVAGAVHAGGSHRAAFRVKGDFAAVCGIVVEEVGDGLEGDAVFSVEFLGLAGFVVEGTGVDQGPGVHVVCSGDGGGGEGLAHGGPVTVEFGFLFLEELPGGSGEELVQTAVPG